VGERPPGAVNLGGWEPYNFKVGGRRHEMERPGLYRLAGWLARLLGGSLLHPVGHRGRESGKKRVQRVRWIGGMCPRGWLHCVITMVIPYLHDARINRTYLLSTNLEPEAKTLFGVPMNFRIAFPPNIPSFLNTWTKPGEVAFGAGEERKGRRRGRRQREVSEPPTG